LGIDVELIFGVWEIASLGTGQELADRDDGVPVGSALIIRLGLPRRSSRGHGQWIMVHDVARHLGFWPGGSW
jgi:hypothetical protein